MKTWTNPLLLGHDTKEFGINTDIFEANLVNIILLVVLLFYVLGNVLKANLSARQMKIFDSVQDSEKKLSEAKERLKEANLQWEQASLSLEQVKKAAELKKMNILENQYKQAQYDLIQRFDNSLSNLRFREKQIVDSVVRDTTILTFSKVEEQLSKKLGKAEQILLLDKKISELGEYIERGGY